jgi:hypothetical protein
MEQKGGIAPTRAWKDTKTWLLNSFLAWILATIIPAGCGVLVALFAPISMTHLNQAGYGVVGALGGLIIFVCAAYLVYLMITPYRQRDEARHQIEQLEEKLRSKLALFVESNSVPAGYVPKGEQQSWFWRLRVKNTAISPIARCYGEIVECYRIGAGGSRTIPDETWPRESHGLPWGRQQGGTYELSLAAEEIAYLDYIMIPNEQSGILYVPSRPNSPNDRPDYKSYPIACDNLEFKIAVGSREQSMKPSVITFRFEWNGGSKAKITVVENISPQDSDK